MSKLSAASTALTFLSAAGVVATSFLVAKAAPKASILLKKAEVEKGEKLTNLEKIKVAGPVYIPSVAVGVSTIACIFGANMLNKRSQAALTSAYALLDNAYREYRGKVKELYGEDADHRVVEEVAKEQYEAGEFDIQEDELLFYDPNSLQYFVSTIDQVLQKTELEDGMECYYISTPFDVLPSMLNSW